jgi:hypothetical protein
MKRALSLLLLVSLAHVAAAQTITSRISGTVADPQGAVVPGAKVQVESQETGALYEATASSRGEWAIPSLPVGSYKVSVSAPAFKTSVTPGVSLEPNVPATVATRLEIGSVAETVQVSAGAEMLQTESATISSTVTGRQISELPFQSRNALDLLITQAGTATPGTQRTTSINGLGKSSMNITLDGVNIQDSVNKSSDGFLAWLMPRADTVEEVSIQTSALGAESSSEGAAQIRFVTRSGTNQWHGGVFWQLRNDALNANYYFNKIDGLPRDKIKLNQFGGRLGGPIIRNRLFFFFADEEFRLPQSYDTSALLLNQTAMNGIYRYRDAASGQTQSVNLYALAAQASGGLPAGVRPFATTPDSIILSTLQQMNALAVNGSLSDRVSRASDYNRNDLFFQTPGNNHRRWLTGKIDANLTSRHQFAVSYRYQSYVAVPDAVNGIYPVLPGAGAVLGTPLSVGNGGTRRIVFAPSASLRSILTPRWTSELRVGMTAGSTLFRDDVSPNSFAAWKGVAPVFNYATSPYTTASQTRNDRPIWQGSETITTTLGGHLLSLGASYSRIGFWQQSIGVAMIPQVTFAVAANDPVNTGNTSIFTLANFPNSTAANRTEAASLYALLTGRVSGINRSVNLDENTRQYGANPTADRIHQKQFGLFVQDAWKVHPRLTLNAGLRWDVQLPFISENGTYTRVGYDGLWGLSGAGHLFQPGVLTGAVPQYYQTNSDTPAYPTYWKRFQPSVGFAWRAPGQHGLVIRGGYSIASVREGLDVFLTNGWGSNQGRTISTSISPGNNPAEFGAPGSVWFRDATLPSRSVPATPSYPLQVVSGNGVFDFDPHLRPGYVQSWTLSVQREIFKTAIDVRYVGNHGTSLWRRFNLNEVNIIENGFLDEFRLAQSNLNIARVTNPTSTNFGNQGLAGQRNIPILSTALGLTSDTTFATYLRNGEAGRLADAIAFNAARMKNLTNAGYPVNFFVVNPTVGSGAAMLTTNGGQSTYNALQVEVRRRMASGLFVQTSYSWSKALSNMFSSRSGARSQPSTFRNPSIDKGPSPWDMRHNWKANWIYELPFGPNRRFLRSSQGVVRRLVEGWQIASVTRVQSGSPELVRGGRMVLNSSGNEGLEADGGVILHNMTAQQFQSMVSIRKTGNGLVYYLPQSLIDNTQAAFETGGKSLANLNPSAPYIGPPTTAGQLGYRIYLYGPWQTHFDFNVAKKIRIAERKEFELRGQFLNIFNLTNFLLTSAGDDLATPTLNNNASFGQTRAAFRDFTVAGTNNPGPRVIEISLRFNF